MDGDLKAGGYEMPGGHLSDVELATLAERGLADPRSAAAARHLEGCRRCLATFAEFARHLNGQALPSGTTVPAPYLAAAKAIVDWPPRVAQARLRGRSRSRYRYLVPACAALALLLVLAFRLGDLLAPPPRHCPSIARALQSDSHRGLVHLDVDLLAQDGPPVWRDGAPGDRAAVRAELARLQQEYEPGRPDADLAYWRVAGHLSLADLDLASDLLDEARDLGAEDWRLRFLSAHLAYRRSDLQEAGRLLTALNEEQPDNGPILLNLGLVRRELADPRASETLGEVSRRFPGTLLARRASRG